MRVPFTFTLSLTEWSAANNLDAALPATRQLWNKEADALYLRIKDRPSKTEADLAQMSDTDLVEPRRNHGARA